MEMKTVKIKWEILKRTKRGTDLISKEKYNVNGNEGHFKIVSALGEWGTIWELWLNDTRLCNVWHDKCGIKKSAVHELEMDYLNYRNEVEALREYTRTTNKKWNGKLEYCLKRVARLNNVTMR